MQSTGVSAAALARCGATGQRDTALQPVLRTGHQVPEEDAVQGVMHMQEAEAEPPLPEQ